MSIQSMMLRACGVIGFGFKPPLCSRLIVPLYQTHAGVKSIASKLGLPEKPKKPSSVFLQYLQIVRPKLAAANPSLKNSELVKLAAVEWKTCDPSLKEKLCKEFDKALASYLVELEKYHRSLSPQDQEAIRKATVAAKERKATRDFKKEMKKLNKPKKPLNSFMLFIQELRAKGTIPPTGPESFREASKLYKELPESKLKELQAKSEAASRQYKADLEAWEERMVSTGMIDVVYESKRSSKKA